MYAVIKDGGREFRVSEGDVLDVDLKKSLSPGDGVEFPNVLLVKKSEEEVLVGTPAVDGAVVTGTVQDHVKGEKIVSYKYKRRQGYHRKRGHRQSFTRVRIEEIRA